ncbi:MAG: RNA polymerase sigma factor region1.1 domain-containing protein, partial [Bdellovibrionota bacterium]
MKKTSKAKTKSNSKKSVKKVSSKNQGAKKKASKNGNLKVRSVKVVAVSKKQTAKVVAAGAVDLEKVLSVTTASLESFTSEPVKIKKRVKAAKSENKSDEPARKGRKRQKEMKEVKQLIHLGKEKGFLTYEEVNEALPEDVSSEGDIDDVMLMLDEMDIEVVDEAEDFKPKAATKQQASSHSFDEDEDSDDDAISRSNDPIRMYLRKMGQVSLLTRDGEVEIAKRIEEGESEVLSVVLRSDFGIKEILLLEDRLKRRTIRVNDIIRGYEENTEEGEDGQPVVNTAAPDQTDRVLKLIAKAKKKYTEINNYREAAESSVKSKAEEARAKIEKLRDDIFAILKEIDLNRKFINKISAKLKNLVTRIEKSQQSIHLAERKLGLKENQIKDLVVTLDKGKEDPKKVATKLKISPEQLA